MNTRPALVMSPDGAEHGAAAPRLPCGAASRDGGLGRVDHQGGNRPTARNPPDPFARARQGR